MNVAIIGTGYVGLVSGVCLAQSGHEVVCVDVQADRVQMIRDGTPPFFEPGLADLLTEALDSRRFSVTTNSDEAVRAAQVILMTVGTPTNNNQIDLTALESALRGVGRALRDCDDVKTVVIRSTVIPGTTDTFALGILEEESGKSVGAGLGLAMNPEFLREGSAILDFQNPDRIVIGALDAVSAEALCALYADHQCSKIVTTPRNAELIKYASNALLATLISFSNEIGGLCEAIDFADSDVVMAGVHLDRRLSPVIHGERITPGILEYIRSGVGFGGSCLPKDVAALSRFCQTAGAATSLLDSVLNVNGARADAVVRILREELGELSGKIIVLLGVAFKAGTSDIRESPALRIADRLLALGAQVRAVDPLAVQMASGCDERITLLNDPDPAFAGADAVALVTAWPQFDEFDWDALVTSMRGACIIDGRNALRERAWPPETRYRAIGTSRSSPRERVPA